MVQEADLVRLRRPRYVADIPDALYMVEEKPRAMGTAGVDVLAAAFPGIITQIMALLLKIKLISGNKAINITIVILIRDMRRN